MNKKPSRRNRKISDLWAFGVRREPLAAPEGLKARVIESLRTIYDPEIPVNIYDLGLVYGLDVAPSGEVRIRMTLTAANCPVAQSFPGTVQAALLSIPGVTDVKVELVWDPPWDRGHMSEAARLQLGLM